MKSWSRKYYICLKPTLELVDSYVEINHFKSINSGKYGTSVEHFDLLSPYNVKVHKK